jgi:hypothetical protein
MSISLPGIARMEAVERTSLPSSKRLLAAAEAERQRLERELQRSLSRAAAAAADLQRAVETGNEVRQRLALLDQLADGATSEDSQRPRAKPRPAPAHATTVRGAQIRRLAVRLLAASPEPEHPIHYARWFDLFTDAGYAIEAREPLANFLTQVTRSPVVVRGAEAGTYALDLDVPRRLREELHDLHVELSRIHHGQQTIDGIVSLRERRNDLTAAIARVERELQEATESLGLELRF